MSTAQCEKPAGNPPAGPDRTKRHLIEISRNGHDWIPISLVFPIPHDHGWQRDKAEYYLAAAKMSFRPIAQGFIQIRLRVEDTTPARPPAVKLEEAPREKGKRRRG